LRLCRSTAGFEKICRQAGRLNRQPNVHRKCGYRINKKNPQAALTLPGGVFITAIVKQNNLNSDQFRLGCPVAVHYDHIGQGPCRTLPCLPSNDYYQWPATIIDMLCLPYHNILTNVKKNHYMWYVDALCD
jgi:hypothetical protein